MLPLWGEFQTSESLQIICKSGAAKDDDDNNEDDDDDDDNNDDDLLKIIDPDWSSRSATVRIRNEVEDGIGRRGGGGGGGYCGARKGLAAFDSGVDSSDTFLAV